jgi:hypothetical protein
MKGMVMFKLPHISFLPPSDAPVAATRLRGQILVSSPARHVAPCLRFLFLPAGLPPLVRGFLVFLGPETFFSPEGLQIVSNSDCSYIEGVTLDMLTGVEVPSEKIRPTYDPTLRCGF